MRSCTNSHLRWCWYIYLRHCLGICDGLILCPCPNRFCCALVVTTLTFFNIDLDFRVFERDLERDLLYRCFDLDRDLERDLLYRCFDLDRDLERDLLYRCFDIDRDLERDLLYRCFDLDRDLERDLLYRCFDLDRDLCFNVIPFNLASISISFKISFLSIFGYICFNSSNDAPFTNKYSFFNVLNLFCDE